MFRTLDLLILLIILPICIIPYLLIFFILYFFEGYPIFFRQIRLGKDQKEFYLYKFRTMIIGAEHIGTKLNSYKVNFVITIL